MIDSLCTTVVNSSPKSGDGKLFGFEIKWQKETIRKPKDWLQTYDNAEFALINQTNFLEFVL